MVIRGGCEVRALAIGALTAFFVAVVPGTALGQSGELSIHNVERAGSELGFTVLAPQGAAFAAGDLEVTVNELEPEDVRASSQLVPRGAVLVIDTSRSMDEPREPGEQAPIAAAKAAAAQFLGSLEAIDELALISFDGEVETLSDFSTDREGLFEAVGSLKTGPGGTALYEGVIEAVGLVKNQEVAQRNIVLLSDGRSRLEDSTLDEALVAAQEAHATIHIVALASTQYDPETVAPLAEQTGGKLLTTADPAELSALFGGLARGLATGYEVSMTDPDPTEDELHIVVAAAGETIATAKALWAPPESTADRGPLLIETLPRPAVFLVVFLAVAVLVAVVSETMRRRRLSPIHRLRWYEEPAGSEIDSETLINAAVLKRAKEVATTLAARTGYLERIELSIESAGLRWRAGEVIVASVGLALAGGLLFYSLGGFGWALLGLVLGAAGPAGYVQRKATSRRRAFYEQLSDVLLLMSGALKAGYSLQQAVATVGEDARPPASEEFRRTMAEVRLGASLDDALQALARRIGILDFEWSVLAIQIQREVGGNLAEILEIISQTIRERERLRRQLNTLTAEGRLSGWVLGLMPFAMAGLLLIRAPDYLAPLYETSLGLTMVGASAALMVVGILWMRKIVKVEV
jgi:tight adherence protein B